MENDRGGLDAMNEELKSLIECTPGDVISRDVIDIRTGITLCSEGHVLTEESIEWLQKFNCSDIYVKRSSWQNVWNLEEGIVETYVITKEKVGKLLQDLTDGRVLDAAALKEVEESFTAQLQDNQTIIGCVNIIKNVDEYTYAHCMNVGMLAVLIGRWLRLEEQQIKEVFETGILHDCGKYRVAPDVLNKKGGLSREEYGVAKKHVLYGFDLIKDSRDISDDVKMGVLTHHERIDGSGYPRALKDDKIPLFGKIIGVADVYDAMISERIYKRRQMPFVVMERMMREGIGKLDTEILFTFLNNIANYYMGALLKLSTGVVGEVEIGRAHV